MTKKHLCIFAAFAILFGFALSGCQSTCDNLPTQAYAQVRIVNALAHADTVNVYIDGNLFDVGFYDLGNYSGSSHPFGYINKFKSNGHFLNPGMHHVAVLKAGTADTIVTTDVQFSDFRQSLIFLGRYHGQQFQKPIMRYVRDNLRPADDTKSFMRFVHGVSDASGLDVYFSQTPKIVNGVAVPDVSLSFGEISDNHHSGTGTGLSASDYVTIPKVGNTGLLVTAKGDTSKVLFLSPYGFSSSGLVGTIIMRGETLPVDDEPAVSTVEIADCVDCNGTYQQDVKTIGVRLLNASRYDSLGLLLGGQFDGTPWTPRTNIPLQQRVLGVPMDSLSMYLPLNPALHGTALYWFSPKSNAGDTIGIGKEVFSANERYTFVSLDSSLLGGTRPAIRALVLRDSMGIPEDTNYNRVRFVNTSPDHTVSFMVNGETYTLTQGQVQITDAPIYQSGAIKTYQIQVNDGSTTGTVTFQMKYGSIRTPITVFFLPATTSNPFPYTIAQE